MEKLIKEEESDIKDNEDIIDIKDEILLENIIETGNCLTTVCIDYYISGQGLTLYKRV